MISPIALKRRVEPVDRDELRPLNDFRPGLSAGRPHEHGVLAETRGEPAQSVLDAAIQMPNRHELLTPRHRLLLAQGLERRRDGYEALGIVALHALGTLEIQEVLQRPLAERQEVKLNAGRKVA